MKQKLLKSLRLRLCAFVALVLCAAGNAWGAEEVYKTALFGSSYNSQSVGSYTATWTATNDGFTVSLANFNNNNNSWDYVKCGRKNTASVGTITTSDAIDKAISKVVVTIDAITANNVNSITLYTSSDNSTWTEAGSFSKATGAKEVSLASPSANLYYKVEFDCASGSSNGLVTVSKVEYYYNPGGAVSPSISADDVEIAYNATSSAIEYTINNGVADGSLSATTEAEWLTIGTIGATVPFTCTANESGERSATVTLTYTYNTSETVIKNVIVTQAANPNGPGSENNPYTVAQARAAIDAAEGVTDVYATGIVSEIPTAWSTQYNNITFNFIDEDGSDFLQAFRCVSTTNADASTVAVGDIVVVKGNLTKYGSTYEFGAGCQLVSLTHPAAAVEAPTFSPEAGTYAEAQDVTISCETSGATIYYTTDGSDPTTSSSVYSSAITISETTTIKAIAYVGTDASTVATATYYFCSADDPYTVTQALAFESYQLPTSEIYVTGIVSTAPTQAPTNSGQMTYFISVDGEATNQLEVYKGKGLNEAAFTAQTDIQVGDIVTIYGVVKDYNGTIEFDTNNYLVSFERPQSAEPSITVNPATANPTASEGEGTLDIEYANLTISDMTDFGIQFCDAEGEELNEEPNWIEVLVAEQDPSVGEGFVVSYVVEENTSTTARTAYFKVYAMDDEEFVYSNLVTITQAGFVVDYATLPFEFDGGKADIDGTDGLTQNGLGSDYGTAPKLKFDGTGDYVILKFDERPGVLTFDIKGNSFSGGTFTVQTSEDGVAYTDLATYTTLGETETKTFSNLGEDVRYIKWIYTEKVGGNVALGNINLAEYGTIVLDNYTLAIANADNVNILATYGEEVLVNGDNAEVTEGTEITLAVTPAEGYDFESLTIAGAEEGQTVTPTASTTDGVWTFTMPSFDVTVTATVVEHVEPETASYVLATSITSGKRYVIASGTEGSVQVMAEQKTNNRGAVAATVAADGSLSVSEEYEFVIEGDETDGYTIYDENDDKGAGYLYAASSGKNWLMTQTENDVNGIWTITISDGVASIVAEGSSNRNVMQYNPNNGSPIFSCYGSASQSPVYLYEKVEEETPITVTVGSAGYTTYVTPAAVSFPEGVEAFIVTSFTTSSMHMESVTAVPAGTPIVVKAAADTYTLPAATETDDVAGNLLLASDGTVNGGANIYVLANKSKGVGFYPTAETIMIPEGKAYLNTGDTPVKEFIAFEFGGADGVQNIDVNVNLNAEIYNLAGQRMSRPVKGVNIINGKKVVIK